MTTPEIKPEWVEKFRAAWLRADAEGRAGKRVEAALAEVAPLIAAQAWDEGFDTGATHGIAYQAGSNDSLPRRPGLNPYRAEAGRADQ